MSFGYDATASLAPLNYTQSFLNPTGQVQANLAYVGGENQAALSPTTLYGPSGIGGAYYQIPTYPSFGEASSGYTAPSPTSVFDTGTTPYNSYYTKQYPTSNYSQPTTTSVFDTGTTPYNDYGVTANKMMPSSYYPSSTPTSSYTPPAMPDYSSYAPMAQSDFSSLYSNRISPDFGSYYQQAQTPSYSALPDYASMYQIPQATDFSQRFPDYTQSPTSSFDPTSYLMSRRGQTLDQSFDEFGSGASYAPPDPQYDPYAAIMNHIGQQSFTGEPPSYLQPDFNQRFPSYMLPPTFPSLQFSGEPVSPIGGLPDMFGRHLPSIDTSSYFNQPDLSGGSVTPDMTQYFGSDALSNRIPNWEGFGGTGISSYPQNVPPPDSFARRFGTMPDATFSGDNTDLIRQLQETLGTIDQGATSSSTLTPSDILLRRGDIGTPDYGGYGATDYNTFQQGSFLPPWQASIPSPYNSPATIDAIKRQASQYGYDPAALTAMSQMESGFNPTTATGSYRGVTQMGPTSFSEAGGTLGGLTWDQYQQATPAQQIGAYGDWLNYYSQDPNSAASLVTGGIGSLPPEMQAAIMQGTQFGPNATRWPTALAGGNMTTPTTTSPQAAALGNTSIATMNDVYANRMAQWPQQQLYTNYYGPYSGPVLKRQ